MQQQAFNLLSILADGQCYSDRQLAEKLQVSCTRVWQQIAELETLGVPIESVKNKGYRLAQSVELLQLEVIAEWQKQQHLNWKIDYLPATPSTMDCWSKTHIPHQEVCLTEIQTQGRGRQGRQWISPIGTAIALSCTWTFDKPMIALSGLSLAIGVMVQKSCRSGAVQFKWPNDLLIGDKKLGGILIDLRGEINGPCTAIIGIGLNIHSATLLSDIDKPTIDLASLHPKEKDLRTQTVCHLLQELQTGLQAFSDHGFAPYQSLWQQQDALQGEIIALETPQGQIKGIVRGINTEGHLLLECDGVIRTIASGEVIRVHRLKAFA